MDIDRVRYFIIFAETGSLVRASEILHISQPALSKALRLLESEVNQSLVESDGRGLKLTASGVKFKKLAAPLLQDWMNLSKQITPEVENRPVKLGSFEVFTTYFLRKALPELSIDSIEIHELTPGKLEDAVINGTIDLGITYNPIPKKGVEFLEAGKIRMGIYGSKTFEDRKWNEVPFVIPLSPSEGTPSKVMGLDGWPDHTFDRTINYKVTLMESALELMRQGLCVGYLPSFIVDIHNETVLPHLRLSELKCPVPVKDRKQSVFLMQKSGQKESVMFRKLAKAIRSLN